MAYGKLCASFLPASACSWMWSWNILETAVKPNHSAWQPVWKVVPSVQQGMWSIYIKTAEEVCSRVSKGQHKGAKMVFRYRKSSFSWFCSRTHWKGGRSTTSCQVLCRSVIGGVHPFPHGQSSIQKLSQIISTTRLHDSSPGIPDGRRLPGHHRVWCASPPLLGECQSPLCLVRHL